MPSLLAIHISLPTLIHNRIYSYTIAGFNVKEESIDEIEQEESEFDPSVKYVPSQTIDVYTRIPEDEEQDDDDDSQNPEIWEALQPWLPKITQIVKDNRTIVTGQNSARCTQTIHMLMIGNQVWIGSSSVSTRQTMNVTLSSIIMIPI